MPTTARIAYSYWLPKILVILLLGSMAASCGFQWINE
jgi:hypothetical protein